MTRQAIQWVGAGLVAVAAVVGSAAQARTSAPAVFDPAGSDEKAIEIADKVLAKLGGEKWAQTRYIKFTYIFMQGDKRRQQRTHYWDRVKNRCRMEGPSRTRKPVVAVVDHETGEGRATLDGQLLFDQDAKKFVDIANKSFVEDSMWLVLPFRMKAPGARLRYEGEKVAGPITYDMVTLRLPETPNAKYRFYINRKTQLIDSVAVVPKGANVSPVAFQWVDWTDIDGLKFSLRKTQLGGEVQIILQDIELFDELPDSVFTDPAPIDSSLVASSGH